MGLSEVKGEKGAEVNSEKRTEVNNNMEETKTTLKLHYMRPCSIPLSLIWVRYFTGFFQEFLPIFSSSLKPKPGSESMSLGEIKSTVSATLIRAIRGLTFLRCRTKCWLARSVCHSGPDTSTSLHKTTRNIFLQINQQIFQLPAVILWNVC